MKFFASLTIATLAATAMAAPGSGNKCGNNQKVSCCNVSKSPQKIKNGGSGFLNLFDVVVPIQGCFPISVPVFGGSFQQLCGNNVAQCCDNQQSGFFNINIGQCNAIPL